MKIINAIKTFLFKHRHKWEGSAWNCYRIAVEEKCKKCGEYRHHNFEDRLGFAEEPNWREGPSPFAQELRDKKLTKHPDFSVPDKLWDI